MVFMFSTLNTSHFDRSPLNDVAPSNMPYIFLARNTRHFEISPSNNDIEETDCAENVLLKSMILTTSHSCIGPC